MDCEKLLKKMEHISTKNLKFIERPKSDRVRWDFYSRLINVKINKKFVGQFEFTESQRMEHNEKNKKNRNKQIFLTDIGELSFGRFIFYEPERKCWFKLLKKKIAADTKNTSMKDLIDQVRLAVGRSPAIKPPGKFPIYWIITPPGSNVDRNGNSSKVRHWQKGPLSKSSINDLKSRGYDLFPGRSMDIKKLKSMIKNLRPLPESMKK